MAVRCVVRVCPNSVPRSRSKGPDLKYYSFPKDQSLRDKWVEACKQEADLGNAAYVCSNHFQPNDFERDLKAELLHLPPKKLLKNDAVPSLLLTPEQMKKYEVIQRREKLEECLREFNDAPHESRQSVFDLIISDYGIPKIIVTVADEKESTDEPVKDSSSSSKSANHKSRNNVFNLGELCRLCGSYSDSLKSIIGNADFDYQAFIQEYIPTVEINADDLLPNLMCSRCENSLVSWYQFLSMCDTVARKFKVLKKGLITNNINNSIPEVVTIMSDEESSPSVETVKDEFEEEEVNSIYAVDSGIAFIPNDDLSMNISENGNRVRKKKIKRFKRAECEICNKTFRCAYTRKIHIQTVHTDERPYFCAVCAASFKRKDHLQCHIAQVHDRHTRPSQRNAASKRSGSYLCAACGKVFCTKTSYQEHNNSVHNDIRKYHCEQCNLSFNRYSKYYHHKVVLKHARHQQFLKSCRICGLEFQSEVYYIRHMTKHEQVSECEKCELRFESHALFKEHVAESHTSSGEYECETCSRKFNSKTSLFQHKVSHSSDDRPFKCEYCHWRFKNRGHLAVHLYRHTGERPYVCSICNKGFKQKGDMRKHKAGHLLNEKKSSITEIRVLDEKSSHSEVQMLNEKSSLSELQVLDDKSSLSELQVLDDKSSLSELQVLDDKSSLSELQVLDDKSSLSELQVLDDKSSFSEIHVLDEKKSSLSEIQVTIIDNVL